MVELFILRRDMNKLIKSVYTGAFRLKWKLYSFQSEPLEIQRSKNDLHQILSVFSIESYQIYMASDPFNLL